MWCGVFITRGLGFSGALSGEALKLFRCGRLLGVEHVRITKDFKKGINTTSIFILIIIIST
jgi:hypothetical protein